MVSIDRNAEIAGAVNPHNWLGWYGEGLWTYDLGEEVWSILAIPPALDGIPGYEANAIQNVVSMALDVIPSG